MCSCYIRCSTVCSAVLLSLLSTSAFAFTFNSGMNLKPSMKLNMNSDEDTCGVDGSHTRREAIKTAAVALSLTSVFVGNPSQSQAIELNPFTPEDRRTMGGYQQAKRATAYLVDSTTPPSIVPFKASREAAILKQLGSGSGTLKSPYTEETLNLNNFMNKGVFGTIDFVKGVVGTSDDSEEDGEVKKKRAYDATFVFLGVDYDDTTGEDSNLAVGLMTDIFKPRRGQDTALALEFVPISMQTALDKYLSSSDNSAQDALIEALVSEGQVSRTTISNQLPVLQFAKSKGITLIACAPEFSDIQTVRAEGIQYVDASRRSTYVADPVGFIGWTQEPENRMYTERSLLKDFVPKDEKDAEGNFFAERILVHETVATSIARYAVSHPRTLVACVAPIADVRFLKGINGRIPRACRALKPDSNIDDEASTTILLNPSAEETLSQSKFLRLEIGTAPKMLQYQTKVADYLWFSSMPKVNTLPRMMNGFF